jgi:hypothetical protein
MATEAAQGTTAAAIDAYLQEERRYPPSPEFVQQANWNDPTIYERADADPTGTRPGPSGSSARPSTPATTASIAT